MISEVRTREGTYKVIFEEGALDDPAVHLELPAQAQRVALIADATTAGLYGHLAGRSFSERCDVSTFVIPPGEASKSIDTLGALWSFLASEGFHRSDLLVALGGGVVSDVAGMAAATFHRGMPWMVLPTSLLSMVDAAIGGKTAIDLAEGKNLAGAFHAPRAVLADPLALATLPEEEYITGLAEVVKHALIATGPLFSDLTEHRKEVLARDPVTLERLVPEAAQVKIDIVSTDETEQGARAFLNYGHTLAHAIEAVEGYRGRSHGRAVAAGLRFVCRLSRRLGYPDLVDLHEELLSSFGLGDVGEIPEPDLLIEAMRRDKKFQDGIVFVVLQELGSPTTVRVDERDVLATLEEIR